MMMAPASNKQQQPLPLLQFSAATLLFVRRESESRLTSLFYSVFLRATRCQLNQFNWTRSLAPQSSISGGTFGFFSVYLRLFCRVI